MADGGTPWRELLGIEPGQVVAGFSGAVVNALRMKVPSPLKMLSGVVSGTLIAVNIGQPIADMIHTNYVIAVCFFIGYGGVQLLDFILALLRQRYGVPPTNGGPKDASA